MDTPYSYKVELCPLRGALDAVVSVLFPAPCRICGEKLTTASVIPICTSCFTSIEPIADPMCRGAAALLKLRPKPKRRPQLNCAGSAARISTLLTAPRCFAHYNDALSGAILLLKYEEVTRLGTWFADRLANLAHSAGEDFYADLIVPVPLHPDRRRERGYNQAELIARLLARRLGLNSTPSSSCARGLALRIGAIAQRTPEIGPWRLRHPPRSAS